MQTVMGKANMYIQYIRWSATWQHKEAHIYYTWGDHDIFTTTFVILPPVPTKQPWWVWVTHESIYNCVTGLQTVSQTNVH